LTVYVIIFIIDSVLCIGNHCWWLPGNCIGCAGHHYAADDFVFFSFIFCHLIAEVARLIVTRLCHMFDSVPCF